MKEIDIAQGQVLTNKDLVELVGTYKQKEIFKKKGTIKGNTKTSLTNKLGEYCTFIEIKEGRNVSYLITEVFVEIKEKLHGLKYKKGNKKGKYGNHKYSLSRLMEYKLLIVLNKLTDLNFAEEYYEYVGYSSAKEFIEEIGLEVDMQMEADGRKICDGKGYVVKSKIAKYHMGIIMEDTNLVDERMYQYFTRALYSLEKKNYIKIDRKYTACLIKVNKTTYDEQDLKFVEVTSSQYEEYTDYWNEIFFDFGFKDKYENKNRFIRYASSEDKNVINNKVRSQLKYMSDLKGYTINFMYEAIKIYVVNPVEVCINLEDLNKIIEEQFFVNSYSIFLYFRHRDYYGCLTYGLSDKLDKEDKKKHLEKNMEEYVYGDFEEDDVLISLLEP